MDAVLAQHVSLHCPTGTIALRSGAMTAAYDRFFIRIHGKSTHGLEPDGGIGAVAIGRLDSVVLTRVKVTAGSRYNIIAEDCLMIGTGYRTEGAG